MAFHRRLFFLLLVLLPTQLGFHFWPSWAFVLGRRVDYFSPTVYLTDILIVFIVAIFLISHFKFLIKQRNFQIFILFAALNIFFASRPWVATYKWIKVLEFVGLGCYIIQNKYRLSDIRLPLTIGVLYSSILAIAQFIVQHSVGLWFLGERTFDITTPGIARWEGFGRLLLRPYATFPHPNVLGGYLAILLPLLTNPIIVFFGYFALLVSFSRSAWIAFFVGVGLINRKLFLPVLLIIVLILLRVNVGEESVKVRNDLSVAAISVWQRSPFVGVGLGNFLVELPRQSLNREGNFLQPVHNIYLLMLAETGIMGLALFLWIVLKARRSVALMSLLLIGFADHYPLTLQQGQLLFTLILSLSMVK